ncbi:hypothetical protein CDL15_Pgr020768 [Punica granatum]|uniref:Uncharacterized protein n=1 Tax=Punica granatum TaxID=22663 RepID=A0A218XV29_PUNGR|nr:hypothetical protein CDL15_Pgr020768 [Punica granatum]
MVHESKNTGLWASVVHESKNTGLWASVLIGEAHLEELEVEWTKNIYAQEGEQNKANQMSNVGASVHCSRSVSYNAHACREQNVTQDASQGTDTSSQSDPTQKEICRKVVGTNKKGRTYVLNWLPCLNYTEAGSSRMAHYRSYPMVQMKNEMEIM